MNDKPKTSVFSMTRPGNGSSMVITYTCPNVEKES